jgi:hypothetical protein
MKSKQMMQTELIFKKLQVILAKLDIKIKKLKIEKEKAKPRFPDAEFSLTNGF